MGFAGDPEYDAFVVCFLGDGAEDVEGFFADGAGVGVGVVNDAGEVVAVFSLPCLVVFDPVVLAGEGVFVGAFFEYVGVEVGLGVFVPVGLEVFVVVGAFVEGGVVFLPCRVGVGGGEDVVFVVVRVVDGVDGGGWGFHVFIIIIFLVFG